MLSLDFDEAELVESDKPEDIQQLQRRMFMNSVTQHLTTRSLQIDIWKMSLKMSRPHGYAREIDEFIHFSIFMGVKHLEFNFNDPKWQENGAIFFSLPDAVYEENDNLEYLKLHRCHLDFNRFTSLRYLKTIFLGCNFITSEQLRYLVVNCPILEKLNLETCEGMDWLRILNPNSGTSMLKELVLDRCFNRDYIQIQGPKLKMFLYSGKVVEFLLENQTRLIEVRLDFSMQDKFERIGHRLVSLMRQLNAVRSMTVCSAFLQLIATEDYIVHNPLDLNVGHLTLNTSLHGTEFIGIRFMLASSPRMKILTLCIVPRKIFNEYVTLITDISNAADFWSWDSILETCLTSSLQELNVHGFEGSDNEMRLIDYIMYCGSCLKSINLFLVPVQEDDHAKREHLEGKCNALMQSYKANSALEIFVDKTFI